MSVALDTIVPVFGIILLGYVLAAVKRDLHVSTLADLALLVCSPALVFSILVRGPVDPDRLGVLVAATLFVLLGTGGLAALYVRVAGRELRGLVLPSTFWNSGNMGLPCARLAFGPEGLEAATIPFVVLALLQFTLGVWIAKGRGGGAEVLRLPLLYACIAAVTISWSGTELPRMVIEPIDMVGSMAIPLMLLNLGVQLRYLRLTDLHHSAVAVTIRIGGGIALALLFVSLFSVEGVVRQVVLLEGVMPAAVANVVLAQRYGANPSLVASTIVLGTIVALVAIPALIVAVA